MHTNGYADWIFDPNHPTQGRRFINTRNHFGQLMREANTSFIEMQPRHASRAELERVHAPHYIAGVIDQHVSGEWRGKRPDLAILASTFVGGTLSALDALVHLGARTAIHFPGAKHHAQYGHSSGFCVFNDFSIAADIATRDHRLNIAILDIDAHHGDGNENLTADNPKVLTYSIHEKGIFPGTGNKDVPDKNVFNFSLDGYTGAGGRGKGDDALCFGVSQFIFKLENFRPDIIFIACGADGHQEDPLSSLEYTIDGYVRVARALRQCFPEMPILLGGAGGYLPDTRTPEVWATFAKELSLQH